MKYKIIALPTLIVLSTNTTFAYSTLLNNHHNTWKTEIAGPYSNKDNVFKKTPIHWMKKKQANHKPMHTKGSYTYNPPHAYQTPRLPLPTKPASREIIH